MLVWLVVTVILIETLTATFIGSRNFTAMISREVDLSDHQERHLLELINDYIKLDYFARKM